MTSLRDKTISGMFWSLLQSGGSRVIVFLVTILLARLLTPKDFGLIAMLAIFISVSQTLVSAGFNSALIQKKNVDEEDYSSVFYINLVVSLALYIGLFIAAPFIANFYHQPILTSLTRIMCLIFVINAFSYVQEARLTKEIRFKTLMIINLPSTIFGGVVGIVMAVLGFGVWSIVAMQIITRLAYAIQIWIYSKWKPLFSFNKNKAKGLFSFGSKLVVSDIIMAIYNNIFIVIIGKSYPLSSVGYYQNANSLATIPSDTITSVLGGVTYPIFSSIQDDNIRLKAGYKRVMQQAFFWICPAYVLVAVLATPLFQFVFTAKWLPAVPYFRWLCILGILGPLSVYNLNILNVKGRSDVFLKLEVIRRIVTIIGIIAVLPYGITALLAVQAAGAVFTFFLYGYHSGRFIQYPLIEQVKDILPILLLSLVIGAGILLIDQFLVILPDLVRLLLGFFIGGGSYWLLANYFNFPPYLDFKHIFQSKVFNRFAIKS